MAWIYLTNSPDLASAPELAASRPRLRDGLRLSPISNSILTPKELSSLVSETADYPTHRYGMTSALSEAMDCHESMPYTADHHAKTLVWPELERVWKATEEALCLKRSASLASADHSSSCWRTYQDSFFEGLTKFSWDSMRFGMIVDGLLFQPKRLAPRFSENACSSWPRPVASDTGTWINRSASQGAKDRPSLGAIAKTWRWPRPIATDASKGGPNQIKGGYPSMANLAANWKRWARPTARDWKGQDSPKKHGRHSPSIDIQAQETGHTGYLSPLFHAAMMGFDSDHTQLDAVGMEWFLSRRKKRSKDLLGLKTMEAANP